MKTAETYTYTFPAYALSALFNGDRSGLAPKDCENLDAFLERESYIDEWEQLEVEPSFCKFPEFGLAADCVKLRGTVWERSA